jgi:8-oxo-dGTP diphosphatase
MNVTVESSLCAIIEGDRILLLKKATGIGKGKWYPIGGKIGPGETPESCATREVLEETGLKVSNLKYHGDVTCYFGYDTPPVWVVHTFSTRDFKGSLKKSKEGTIKWFTINEIPYEEMWQDDRHWLPLLLDGKMFNGAFIYNEEGSRLIDHSIMRE